MNLPESPKELSELIKETPTCGYFYNNHCEWCSARLSRVFRMSKAFCNLKCKDFGPYSGNNFTSENQIKFLQLIWNKVNPTGGLIFANKVFEHHYKMPVDIEIPLDYEIIKKDLNFLKDIKGYLGFYLTGSLIIKGATKPPKDYDIVLKFDSIKSLLEANLSKILPEKINEIKTDYFYYIGENPEVYFACMDVENKILYTSTWFDLKIRDIDTNIKIIQTQPKFEEVLKGIVNVHV
jgi:hypothetical protein